MNSLGNGENNYSVNDRSPFAQGNHITYYRIRQIERNGQYSYSKILKLIDSRTNNSSVSPNPAWDEIKITSDFIFEQVEVIDLSGKVITSFKKSLNNRYNVRSFSPGIYVLRVSGKGEMRVLKLVVE